MQSMHVIGIDPGLGGTGYAVLEAVDGGCAVREMGCITSSSRAPLEARIGRIFEGLQAVLERWRPELMILEGLYSDYTFPRTAIVMGHVRGAICLASHLAGARVVEYGATEVKRALTGSGRAGKQQVMKAVTRLLALEERPGSEHVSDALALALVGLSRASRPAARRGGGERRER